MTKPITASEASTMKENTVWIDVRTPAEFEDRHIEGSILHPLGELDSNRIKSLLGQNQACILVCGSGKRAAIAAEKLSSQGINLLHILDGGINAWEEHNLPLVRGRRTISLERQVRIAAGALVLFGTVLGVFVNSGFLVLPAFVGAGLIFAGLTDTCGMAMLLARMPWNQRG